MHDRPPSGLAVKADAWMQPRLNTVTGESRLFNLHPMVVINLSCIPTFVEMHVQKH